MAKLGLENLSESMFYVLMALRKANRCGTEIAEFVSVKTKQRVNIGPGTLYTILSKFEKEHLIEEVEIVGRKRTYQISEKGLKYFCNEYDRLKKLVEDASSEGEL
ncbi:MAG: PadR family transcriptional regulator [Erysipelotrichaceae bacterium]